MLSQKETGTQSEPSYPLSRCTLGTKLIRPQAWNIEAANEEGRTWLTSGTLPTSLWNHCNLLKCFMWWASPMSWVSFTSIHTHTHTHTHTTPPVPFHLPECGKTSYLHNCTSWVIKVQTHWNFSEVLGKYLVWDCSWNAGPGPDTSWWSPAWRNQILI